MRVSLKALLAVAGIMARDCTRRAGTTGARPWSWLRNGVVAAPEPSPCERPETPQWRTGWMSSSTGADLAASLAGPLVDTGLHQTCYLAEARRRRPAGFLGMPGRTSRIWAWRAALLGLSLTMANAAEAATCTWTGATNNSWQTATNWSGCGGGVPGSSDTATINSGTATLASTASASSVSVGSGATLGLGGKTLTVSNGFTSTSGTLSLGSSGTLALTGGTSSIGTVDSASSGTISSSGNLTLAKALSNTSVNLTLGGGTLTLGSLTHSIGTLSLTSASTIDFGTSSAQLTVSTLTLNGKTLNASNWTAGTDHFYANAITGTTTYDERGLAPFNLITLGGNSSDVTYWGSASPNELLAVTGTSNRCAAYKWDMSSLPSVIDTGGKTGVVWSGTIKLYGYSCVGGGTGGFYIGMAGAGTAQTATTVAGLAIQQSRTIVDSDGVIVNNYGSSCSNGSYHTYWQGTSGMTFGFDASTTGQGCDVALSFPVQLVKTAAYASGTISTTQLLASPGSIANNSTSDWGGVLDYSGGTVYSIDGAHAVTINSGLDYWNGTYTTPQNSPKGGSANWDATTTNWTNSDGTLSSSWGDSATAKFQGTAGTVNLASGYSPNIAGISFGTTGYTISTTDTGTLALSQNATIATTASGYSATISAPISGAYDLTFTPTTSGTLTLSGANTYSGTTTISTGGTLTIGGAGQLGGGSYSKAITNNGTLNYNSTAPQTLSGIISTSSGTGNLTQTGSGTLTLGAANTYNGTTTISSGKLVASNATALGATGSGTTVSSGGTLSLSGSISIGSEALSLAGTGTSGSAGALENLSGSNTYGGAITQTADSTIGVTAGSLTLSNSISGAYTLSFAPSSSTTITASGAIGGSGALAVKHTGAGNTIITQYNNTYTGGTTVSSGTLTAKVGGDATTLTPFGTGSIFIDQNGVLEIDNRDAPGGNYWNFFGNKITGTGTLNAYGPKGLNFQRLELSSSSHVSGLDAFTGTVNIAAYNVQLENSNTAATVNVSSGAIFQISTSNAGDSTIGVLTGSGTVSGMAGTTGKLTMGKGDGSGTFSGVISSGVTNSQNGGVSAVTKIGTGTQTLTGVHTYTGPTTISGGTLKIDGAGQLGSGSYAGAIANTAAFVYNSSANQTLSGVISGTAGTLTMSGTGTLTLSGDNTYTGATSISSGTVYVNGNQSTASGAVSVTGGTLGGSGTVGGATTVSGGTLSPGAGTVGTAGGVGTLSFSKGLTLQSGATTAIELGQTGTGAKNDLISVTGNVVLGGTLTVTQSAASGSAFGAGTYRLFNVSSGTVSGSFAAINLPAGYVGGIDTGTSGQVNLVVAATSSTTYWDGSGTVGNGTVEGGAGTWNANGTNWTISSGGANGKWPGSTSTATFGGTATAGTVTLDTGYSPSLGGISFAKDGYTIATTDTGTLALSQNATIATTTSGFTSLTISAPISGSYGLTFAPTTSGTLTLSGANTYTGSTVVSRGKLVAANATALGTTGSGTTVSSGATLSLSGGISISSESLVIAGTGVSSAGALENLSGINTYGGAITQTAASTIGVTAGSLTLSGGISGAYKLTFAPAIGTTITANGVIGAGALSLTQSGAGTTTLSANNTYTGSTTVSAGTLYINGSTSASGGVSVSGGTLGGSGTVGGATTVANGGTLSPGAGTVGTAAGIGTLSFNNGLTLQSGSITAIELGQTGTGSQNDLVSVTGNLTLAGTLNVTQSNGGTFGAGTYRLFNYSSGTVSGSFSTVTVPAGFIAGIDTGTPGQVNLVVEAASSATYWDGSGTVGNRTVDGGTGTWASAATNWTTSTGSANGTWPGGTATATFGGTAGTVTLGTGYSPSLGGISFANDGYTIATTDTGTLALSQNATIATTASGYSATISAPISGSGHGITWSPTTSGTLTLSGTNTYTGTTTISAGTLLVTGSTISASAVSVATSATLGGTGTVGGSVTVSGKLSPGASAAAGSVGTLSTGALTMSGSSATLNLDLAASGTTGGGVNDLVQVTGNLNLNGALAINKLSGFNTTGKYTLITYTGTRTGTFASDNLSSIGYQGVLQYDDTNKQVNLVSVPRVRFSQVSNAGTGTFTFVMSGLDTTSTTVTTATAGTAVTSSVFNGTAGTAVTVSQTPPGGWPSQPVSISCVDASGGSNGNGTGALGTVSGASVSLTTSQMRAGADITCTFTNANNGISGVVFNDGGAPSSGSNTGTPNDGLKNGSEAGLSGVTVSLTNCSGTSYGSTTTDGNGAYSLAIPTAQSGQSVCVAAALPNGNLATGANASGTVLPDGSATTVSGKAYTYTRSSSQVGFTAPSSGAVVLNFGEVPASTLSPPTNAKVAQPGVNTVYSHIFKAGTGGTLQVQLGTATAKPTLAGWDAAVYLDTGCTNTVQAGATRLYPSGSTVTVTQGQQVCFVVQQAVPAVAANGNTNALPVNATLTFSNAAPGLTASYTSTDTTTANASAVQLVKEVRNVTQGASTFGTTNQAKSGDVLEYRVTYTNSTTSAVNTFVINDNVPEYTTFQSASAGTTPAALGTCTKNTPANPAPAAQVACSTTQTAGGTGGMTWTFSGTLPAGGTGTVLYQLKVD